jgi:threonine synthase
VVTDEEILNAQRWLARNEGIFVEPASAASIAGFFKSCDSKDVAYSFEKIPPGSRIVCTVTGHGLKDPDAVAKDAVDLAPVAANPEAVRRAIAL